MYKHEQYDEFMAAQARAMEIVDQNDRFDRIDSEIDRADFRAMAREGIADEQDDLLLDLLDASDKLPYQQLHADGQRLRAELDEASDRLATISDEEDAQKTHFLQLAQKVAELAPRRRNEADELAAVHIADIDTMNREALRQHIADIKSDIEQHDRFFEEVGDAWPLPKAATGQQNPATFEIDELPVEPTIRESSDRFQRIRERNVDAPEASQWIALVLADRSRHSVSVDELVDVVYEAVKEEREDRDLRSRITTTLGPKVQGHRIRKMLAEEGFALQYGWRTHYERRPNAKAKQVWKHRIYRALPLDEATSQEYTESFTKILDEHNEVVETIAEQNSDNKVVRELGKYAIERVNFEPCEPVRPIPSPKQIKEFLDRKKAGEAAAHAADKPE